MYTVKRNPLRRGLSSVSLSRYSSPRAVALGDLCALMNLGVATRLARRASLADDEARAPEQGVTWPCTAPRLVGGDKLSAVRSGMGHVYTQETFLKDKMFPMLWICALAAKRLSVQRRQKKKKKKTARTLFWMMGYQWCCGTNGQNIALRWVRNRSIINIMLLFKSTQCYGSDLISYIWFFKA